jgi:hypothetical protein
MKEQLKHFLRHYQRNWIWFWISVLTGYLGLFIRGQQHLLERAPRFLIVTNIVDNQTWIVALSALSVAGIIISLWNISLWKIKGILIGCLTFVWVLFLIVFVQIDLSIGQYSIGAGLTAFLVLLIFHHAKGNNTK